MVIKQIFSYFPTGRISKPEFMKLFKINLEDFKKKQ